MSIITPIEALQWRYATKKFDPTKKLSVEQQFILEESLRLAPSSYGLQAWKFVQVKTEVLRQQLQPLCWVQDQIMSASHLYVLATPVEAHSKSKELIDSFIEDKISTQGGDRETLRGYIEVMEKAIKHGNTSGNPQYTDSWLAHQVYICLGMAMLAMAQYKVDTCPIEGFEPDKVTQLLELDTAGYAARVILVAGFRSEDDKYAHAKKVRFDKESVFIRK